MERMTTYLESNAPHRVNIRRCGRFGRIVWVDLLRRKVPWRTRMRTRSVDPNRPRPLPVAVLMAERRRGKVVGYKSGQSKVADHRSSVISDENVGLSVAVK